MHNYILVKNVPVFVPVFLYAVTMLIFQIKRIISSEKRCNYVVTSSKIPKIWVGRTTVNGEKKRGLPKRRKWSSLLKCWPFKELWTFFVGHVWPNISKGTFECRSTLYFPQGVRAFFDEVRTPNLESSTGVSDVLDSYKVSKTLRIFRNHRSSYESKHTVFLICTFVGLHTPWQVRSNVNSKILNDFRYSFWLCYIFEWQFLVSLV